MNIDTKCPHCDGKFEAPDELVGKTAKCPSCLLEFVVRRANAPSSTPSKPAYKSYGANAPSPTPPKSTYKSYSANSPSNGDDDSRRFCFAMGFFFLFFGVIIAAIIDKKRGATRAVWGVVFSSIVIFLIHSILHFRSLS